MPVSFERKIEKTIRDNLEDCDAPILIVEGAKQIGKTYTINKVGRSMFKHFVEINIVEDKYGKRIFENVHSTDELYMFVQAFSGIELGNIDDTLVFLDEIQEYPQLFTLLKFLRSDKRYRFIASGSLLGLALRKTMSLPIGSMLRLHMYPMDLEEYLWAAGFPKDIITNIKILVKKRNPIPAGIHALMMERFREYLICGGLPYCVSSFIQKRDVVALRRIQNEIHTLYGEDASKYDATNRLHTKAIYDLVPSNIENKKKRIRLKDIEGREFSKFSEYEEDFDSLIGSGVVLEVKCCTDPTFPLRQSVKNSMLKLYMNDVGLLTALLFGYNVKPLLENVPQINLGNVYETFSAVTLSAKDNTLYYADNKRLGEVDFIIDDQDNLGIIALEIKSGKDYKTHSALDKLMSSENSPSQGIVLSNSGTVEQKDGITYLPIYALAFM